MTDRINSDYTTSITKLKHIMTKNECKDGKRFGRQQSLLTTTMMMTWTSESQNDDGMKGRATRGCSYNTANYKRSTSRSTSEIKVIQSTRSNKKDDILCFRRRRQLYCWGTTKHRHTRLMMTTVLNNKIVI